MVCKPAQHWEGGPREERLLRSEHDPDDDTFGFGQAFEDAEMWLGGGDVPVKPQNELSPTPWMDAFMFPTVSPIQFRKGHGGLWLYPGHVRHAEFVEAMLEVVELDVCQTQGFRKRRVRHAGPWRFATATRATTGSQARR